MNRDGYEKLFKKENSSCDNSKWRAAFEKAHDIRKFEIELYWKRTTYFWTLLAAIFAGYFVLLSSEESKISHKEIYLTLVASVGFVFTIAWHLAAKGSKFWQENWESHLDLLEDEVTGPLYKVVLNKKGKGSLLSASEAYSVSKLNHWISIFLIVIWCGLMMTPILSNIVKSLQFFSVFFGESITGATILELIIIITTFVFVTLMYKKAKTEFKNNDEIKAKVRNTKLDN